MHDAPESVVVAMWTCVGGVCLFMEEVEASPPKEIERNCIILTDSFRFAGLFSSHPTYYI